MALEHRPIHVRKAIALWCTLGIGLILLLVLVWKYSSHKTAGNRESVSKINTFYTTILDQTQSYFSPK